MGMRGIIKSGFYQVAGFFLLSFVIVSAYAVNAFGETYMYNSTLGVTGVEGADDNHFYLPFGAAVDGSGNVYVADYYNKRIQRYDSKGAYVNTIGETGVSGSDNNHFGPDDPSYGGPQGVAVDGLGNVYVADTWNHRIQKFNSSGAYVSTIGETGVPGSDNGHINAAYGVAVDGSGNVYVADTWNHRIQKFSSDGVYVSTIGETGVPGSNNRRFNGPQGVAVDGWGNIYVADTWNHRIQKFNSDGVYVWTIGETGFSGSDNRHFNSPFGVTVDGSGNVYVADTWNYRIQKYNSRGEYVNTLGVTGVAGSDNRHFNAPYGAAVDGLGNVYVADSVNYRIQKFSQVPGDNCTATLSNDLSLHVPIANYYGNPYSLDFVVDVGAGVLLVNATLLSDTSAFGSCAPATAFLDVFLHIPVVIYNGISYWVNLRHNESSYFIVTGVGAN